MLEVTDLRVYPVKSLHGISLAKAKLNIRGLQFDRNWMVVDTNFKFVTQRQIPKMATIQVSLTEDKLILRHKSMPAFSINLKQTKAPQIEVTVWNDNCQAVDEGEEASKWLTEVLGKREGKALHLVRFADNFKRPVDTDYLQGEDSHTGFSDGFPFLVTNEKSLQQLNNELIKNGAKPVTMDRFRPNIVVRGANALEENDIDSITETNGKFSLALRKPCKRCKVTTINQDTAEIAEPKEPLKTLVTLNPFTELKGAFFGQNAILLSGENETISVGDTLRTIKK